jgi:hypothetical protein
VSDPNKQQNRLVGSDWPYANEGNLVSGTAVPKKMSRPGSAPGHATGMPWERARGHAGRILSVPTGMSGHGVNTFAFFVLRLVDKFRIIAPIYSYSY